MALAALIASVHYSSWIPLVTLITGAIVFEIVRFLLVPLKSVSEQKVRHAKRLQVIIVIAFACFFVWAIIQSDL